MNIHHTTTTTPRRRFAGLPDVPSCRVVIVDDLVGGHREFTLPVPPDEAERSCIELEAARYFVDRLSLFGDGADMSLGVSWRKTRGSIVVRWFAVDGDVDRALAERDDEWEQLTGGSRQ